VYWKAREGLFSSELILLRILRFELAVSLAFWPLTRAVRGFFGILDPTKVPTPDKLSRVTYQLGIMLVSDSYLRSSVLGWHPADLAVAALAIALRGAGAEATVAQVAQKMGRNVEKIEGTIIFSLFIRRKLGLQRGVFPIWQSNV
jgi:hypothetical protein